MLEGIKPIQALDEYDDNTESSSSNESSGNEEDCDCDGKFKY